MGSSVLADDVLEFWYVESDPSQWFRKDEHYDSLIRDRFAELVEEALRGEHDDWATSDRVPWRSSLSWTSFRAISSGTMPGPYAGDTKALEISLATQARGTWTELEADYKHFILVPMMHSEDLEVQEKSLPLFKDHCAEDVYAYGVKHRDSVKRFGRFPIATPSWAVNPHPKSLSSSRHRVRLSECKPIDLIDFIENLEIVFVPST